MKCRKAFELDLAAFVVDPSSEAWAAFRAHYPGCEDCAAEVAVWDEMQVFLQSGGPGATTAHPPKELLLRYEEQRATLSAIEVAMLAKHLATCRACPDEIAALRTFDFSVVRRQPAPRPQPWWSLGLELVSRIRPVVLHPAFAYALVLMLLYPALIQPRLAGHSLPAEQIALESPWEPTDARQRITTDGDRPEVAPPPPSAEHIPGEPQDAAPAATREATPPTDGDSQLAGANTRPRRAASRRAQPAGSAAGDGAPPAHPADDAPATKASPVAADDEDASDALVPREPADADSDEPRVLGLADTEEPHDDARHARRAVKGAGATHDDAERDGSWQTIVLAPGRTPAVQRANLATGVVLRLPPADRDVEIRVVGPGGREASRETVRSPSGEPIEVRIRATELIAGTYRVLTQTSELLFIVR